MPPKNKSKSQSTVVESKYIPRPAPCLEDIDGESIIEFLREYPKYVKGFPTSDTLKPLSLVECIDTDLLSELGNRYTARKQPSSPDWSPKDDNFVKNHLEEIACFNTMPEFLHALSQQRIDSNQIISSPLNAVLSYNLVFDRLVKRGKAFKIQDKILIRYYVMGMQNIPQVKSKLDQLLLCDGTTLAFMKLSCENVVLEYAQRVSADQLSSFSFDPVVGCHLPVAASSSSLQSSSSQSSSVFVNPSSSTSSSSIINPSSSNLFPSSSSIQVKSESSSPICKACGGIWSHEHWVQCPKRIANQAGVRKSINAVFLTGNQYVPCHHVTASGLKGEMKVPAFKDAMAEVSCITEAALAALSKGGVAYQRSQSVNSLVMPDGREYSCVDVIRMQGACDVYGSDVVKLYYHVIPDIKREFILIGYDYGGLDSDSYLDALDRGKSSGDYCNNV